MPAMQVDEAAAPGECPRCGKPLADARIVYDTQKTFRVDCDNGTLVRGVDPVDAGPPPLRTVCCNNKDCLYRWRLTADAEVVTTLEMAERRRREEGLRQWHRALMEQGYNHVEKRAYAVARDDVVWFPRAVEAARVVACGVELDGVDFNGLGEATARIWADVVMLKVFEDENELSVRPGARQTRFHWDVNEMIELYVGRAGR
jgi:hypothetical protein